MSSQTTELETHGIDTPKDVKVGDLPRTEREAVLDAERRDEMNEHTSIRVDGQKLPTPAEAEVAMESGVEAVQERSDLKPDVTPTAAADMGATEEQVNRAAVPPPPEGESAPMRKEDTGG